MNKVLSKKTKGLEKTTNGIYYKINKKGTGRKAIPEFVVKVHYTGKLIDGTVFDSSYRRNGSSEFQLGVGQVIKSWDEGIQLLNEDDSASFLFTPDFAYGVSGAGDTIPPNAILLFDVELVSIK